MNQDEIFGLSMSQEFQTEYYSRQLDNIKDPDTLRKAAKLMLVSYQRQRAATQWLLKQNLGLDQKSSGRMNR